MNLDKFTGCILAVAVSDALGAPFEMMTADEIENLEILGYVLDNYFCPSINPHPFLDVAGKSKGSWSGGTELTLITMESLIESGCAFDLDILAKKHMEAYQNAKRRGWGKTTKKACKHLLEGVSWKESGEPEGKGNGVAMKIAPLALLQSIRGKNIFVFFKDCIDYARMTHRFPSAVIAGCIHAYGVLLLLKNNTITSAGFLEQVLGITIFLEDYFPPHPEPLSQTLATLKELHQTGTLFDLSHKEIRTRFGGGTKAAFSAVNSMATAYAAFLRNSESFDCIFDCIRMGGYTDSNAAIAGSLIGAKYGTAIIPEKFMENLEAHDHIRNRTQVFFEIAVSKT